MSFHGSYSPEDVEFLLKPVKYEYVSVEEKERMIQSGEKHYSEMLSEEKVPSESYINLYNDLLRENSGRLHGDIEKLASRIVEKKGEVVTLVSLARAGTPVGVLLQRKLVAMGIDSRHYSISIIRDRGIDQVAMNKITRERSRESIVFVDGWTGKGAITNELQKSLEGTGVEPYLAVIADPAGRASVAATVDDYVIPSGILNGIVSGLISRSILNENVVGNEDFHACLFQESLKKHDCSQAFIEAIEASSPVVEGRDWNPETALSCEANAKKAVKDIMEACGVTDVNRVKPGIAEATRAILRRLPDSIHLKNLDDVNTNHIVHLANEAGMTIHLLSEDCPYHAITVIRSLGE
jgi:hypothetical protein